MLNSHAPLVNMKKCEKNLSGCLCCSFHGKQVMQSAPDELELRERQLLCLLNNHDEFSKQTSELLLRKVSVKSMLARELIEQQGCCSQFAECLNSNREEVKTNKTVYSDEDTENCHRYDSDPISTILAENI